MKTILAAGAAVALLAGCSNPYTGRTDYGRTAALGALLGAGAGIGTAALSAPSGPRRQYGYGYASNRAYLPPVADYGYGGYGRRGWW